MSEKVLVLGDYRQTITIVRSLARAGFRVTLGSDNPASSTALSRYVSDLWVYDASSAERFRDHLESHLRAERPDFVFTVGESLLRRLIRFAGRFEPLSTWVNPELATVARCFDKSALYELAPRLGIPTLPWRRFTGAADWRHRSREMGFPVVVKRRDSARQVDEPKARIFHAPEEFEAFLATLGEADARPMLLQKYHAGVRHNCHVACADGKLIGYFQQRVLSTDELDDTGIGTAGESVAPMADLRAHCERLTQALAYTGIGCIQFLVDEAGGTAAFLEFNARMDSTAVLPYRLGYDYPRLAVELARYRRSRRGVPPGFLEPYAAGKAYHWLRGDFRTWLDALRHRRVSAGLLCAWAFNMAWMSLRSHHLTFEWRDPLPTLDMYWKQFAVPALRRLVRNARPRPAASGGVKPSQA